MVYNSRCCKTCWCFCGNCIDVLNKTRYVSPKLEEKVELSIRELGYEPIRKKCW